MYFTLVSMMTESSIEWTDATWNPVAGCTVLSPGCSNCYAMRMAARLDAMGMEKYKGLTRKSGGRAVWTNKVNLDRGVLGQPGKWKKPRRVFVNSMSDLFHEKVPDRFIDKVWNEMETHDRHTFQILTKRPDRMFDFVLKRNSVPANVWLGVSVEDNEYLDRIEWLRKTPAFIRFISFEPLLGSVAGVNLTDIDWAIVGGESGPKSRTMSPEWVGEIQASCKSYGTAFFFKQWGGANKKKAGRKYRGKTWDTYPTKYEAVYPQLSV